MITLPKTPRNRATVRIQTMPEGTWAPRTSQVWTTLPMPLIIDRSSGIAIPGTVLQGGYHLSSISRWCLPDEDRAEFYIDIGTINGESVIAQDLSNTAIKIQVYDDYLEFPNGASSIPTAIKIAGSSTPGWRTIFAGTVISTSTGAQVGIKDFARVTYYCAGVLWRTRMWPLDRHSTASATHAKGHPGYNIPLHGLFRKVLGNKGSGVAPDPFGDISGPPDISSYYALHALPVDGAGATTTAFTDADSVKHALASSRAAGEPLIQVDLASGLFDGAYPWSVSTGDSCWDLLRRVCNRQRGRGSVFADYIDYIDGSLDIVLKARPSHSDDISYSIVTSPGDLPMGTVVTIPAARSGVDAVDVDINGDHRITDEGFQYESRQSSVYDGVVVQGEPIQVLANLNFFGSSLGKRWSSADESAFGAIPAAQIYQRTSSRWRHVWRRYGIPAGYDFTVMAEPGITAYGINYRTNALGSIEVGSSDGLSSEMTLKVLPDLPIYEGWSYASSSPVRFDGAADYLPPSRMPPFVMYRADTDIAGSPTWLPMQLAGFNIQTDDFGLYIVNSAEDSTGARMMASTSAAPNAFLSFVAKYGVPDITLTSGLDLQKFNTVVGIELGTRVSFFTRQAGYLPDTYNQAGRRLTVTIPGAHLWLGAPGAIWELDYARAYTSNRWNAGLKFPSGKAAYIIRDDRNALSFIAGLTWQYYGYIHNPGRWTLRDCGLMTSFKDFADISITYPQLGQVIGKVTYTGDMSTARGERSAALKTPVTSIHYDHDAGETTWRTDYVNYDGSIQ